MSEISIGTKFCDKEIAEDAIMCVHCGRQVEQLFS